jgi:molybdopterin-binding protein
METKESKLSSESTESAEATETVTVTAKEDCNLYAGGQSVALTKGQEVEMTPEEAAAYANLGLVGAGAGVPKGTQGVPRK